MWKHLWLNCHELQKNKIAANFESKYFSPQQPRFGSNTKQAEPVSLNEPHAQHAGKSHLNPNSDFSEEGQMAIIRTFGHKWRLQDEQL